jgi:hypothetical protein
MISWKVGGRYLKKGNLTIGSAIGIETETAATMAIAVVSSKMVASENCSFMAAL